MLHELNFCDWRSRQRQADFIRCLVTVVIAMSFAVIVEWHKWQNFSASYQHLLWQVKQAELSVQTLRQRDQQWQARDVRYQQEYEQLLQWQEYIDAMQHPHNVLTLIRDSLPRGMYFDRLSIDGANAYIEGVVERQVLAARLATNLQTSHKVGSVSQLRLEAPVSRWNSLLFPFQLQLNINTRHESLSNE